MVVPPVAPPSSSGIDAPNMLYRRLASVPIWMAEAGTDMYPSSEWLQPYDSD